MRSFHAIRRVWQKHPNHGHHTPLTVEALEGRLLLFVVLRDDADIDAVAAELLSRLDEQQRRWFAALEANRLGLGGERVVAEITGMSVKTIHRGQQELAHSLATRPTARVRLVGGGRPRAEKKMLR